MCDDDIMSRLTSVFRSVFPNEIVTLSRATTAQDVGGWDSLTHINVIVAVEREFTIRFTTREIAGLGKIGDLMDLIARKSCAKP